MYNVQSNDGGSSTATNEYHAYHDHSGAAELSTTVIHALADVMDRDVTDAGFVLNDSIDPESLNRLFSSTTGGRQRPPGHLAFTVEGYRVTVYSTGEIVITPPAP